MDMEWKHYTNKDNTFSISDIFSFLCFSLYAQLANSDGLGFQKSGFGLLILSFVADFSVEHAKGTVKKIIKTWQRLYKSFVLTCIQATTQG